MSKQGNVITRLSGNKRGVVLINILVIGILLTFIGLSLADLVMAQYRRTSNNVYVSNATLTAEAGIEQTLYELNIDNTFTGFATEQEFFNDSRGRGTYTTQVTNSADNERLIIGTGRTYRPNSGQLVSERKIRVSIVGTSSPEVSVYAGVGGLVLSGSGSINNSDIFVNGKISMSGQARIGSDSTPVNLDVAHVACPPGNNPGPSFPTVCDSSSGEPISFTADTKIYGSVCAKNQTTASPHIETGQGGQGLIAGCVPEPAEMIPYDRTAHINGMTISGSPSASTYDCGSWSDPGSWPANLRLEGNVTLASSCDVTVTGNMHITGDLNLAGGAIMRIADSLGETRPVIVVDGTITAGGGAQVIENSSGISAHFITFKSTAACSPGCADVTGNDLYTSKNQQNITVNGGGNYAGAVFQAYWSKVKISGTGLIGAALGQTVDLSGTGNITFGTSLSSGQTTWTIRSYQREF